MKDEIITVIIFILLISLFVYNSVTIEKRTERLIMHIEDAQENVDKVNAENHFKKVMEVWKKDKKALFYISGHNIILQIDENIILGYEHIKDKDYDKALYNLKKAKFLLEDLHRKEKIRLDNIF